MPTIEDLLAKDKRIAELEAELQRFKSRAFLWDYAKLKIQQPLDPEKATAVLKGFEAAYVAAVADLRKAEAANAELRALLKRLEWISDGECPVCRADTYRDNDVHREGCELKQALAGQGGA